MKKAFEYFNAAIEKDPAYALAYAGLADTYGFYAGMVLPYPEALPKARAAARKAVELDKNLAEARLSTAPVWVVDYDSAGKGSTTAQSNSNPISVHTTITAAFWIRRVGLTKHLRNGGSSSWSRSHRSSSATWRGPITSCDSTTRQSAGRQPGT